MEKNMETTIIYWGYMGIMENGNYYLGFRVWGLGLGVYCSRV